jgi:hypothetical protein
MLPTPPTSPRLLPARGSYRPCCDYYYVLYGERHAAPRPWTRLGRDGRLLPAMLRLSHGRERLGLELCCRPRPLPPDGYAGGGLCCASPGRLCCASGRGMLRLGERHAAPRRRLWTRLGHAATPPCTRLRRDASAATGTSSAATVRGTGPRATGTSRPCRPTGALPARRPVRATSGAEQRRRARAAGQRQYAAPLSVQIVRYRASASGHEAVTRRSRGGHEAATRQGGRPACV